MERIIYRARKPDTSKIYVVNNQVQAIEKVKELNKKAKKKDWVWA
jgi:hypothetical protein